MLAALLLSPAARAQEIPAGATGLFGANLPQQGSLPSSPASPSPGQRIDVLHTVDTQPRPPAPRPGGGADPTALAPATPAASIDFQIPVVASVGRLLPIFGESLFAAPPSTFSPVEGRAPTADYLIGPGDEFMIRGWGQVEIDVRAVVTREGTISIPRVGVYGAVYAQSSELYRPANRLDDYLFGLGVAALKVLVL